MQKFSRGGPTRRNFLPGLSRSATLRSDTKFTVRSRTHLTTWRTLRFALSSSEAKVAGNLPGSITSMNDASAIRLIGFISIFLSVASLQAQTQAEMNADARADFAKADVDLNKTR